MVLVDTSVLIDYLRGTDNHSTSLLNRILESNIPFGITSLIYMEILQGVRTEKDFIAVKEYLDTQRFYGLRDEKASYAAAARIYFTCRKQGLTINSTGDCLIAQTAIENDLFLLHNDSDFVKMQKAVSIKFFHL